MNNAQPLFLQIALKQWEGSCQKADRVFQLIAPEKYASTIAPGTNTVAWIFTHLTWAHDHLHSLMGFRDPLFSNLNEILNDKGKLVHEVISQEDLFKIWRQV